MSPRVFSWSTRGGDGSDMLQAKGEIFFTDLPAGNTIIIDAYDDQGFAKATEAVAAKEGNIEEGEERTLQEGQEDRGETGGGTQDNNAGNGSPEEDVSDEDSLELQPSRRNANATTSLTPPSIARLAASSSRNTPATSTPPNGQPNRLSRTLTTKANYSTVI
ncbi:hypothetical protein E4U17_000442 [Claviceps sp. LM77 group G4]|nr:hypothetical protein E4U17_000442 [Claviceps sp. LM77 group G4]KAG6082427.1 hypothetical protein E4U33_005727 [Claviceps sp. LM78 group G4]